MKIAQIVPGSGRAFYCQNCLRDAQIVKALRTLGHDVILLPMYLPLFADESGLSREAPLFYGAVNTYLREKLPLLRRAPAWLRRALDSRPLLEWAARQAGSTRAAGHEAMTLSMLRGDAGRQAEELARLAGWLVREGPPEVVHLSNALLLGLAPRLRADLGAAIVCSLQDEDGWVNAMREAGRRRVWQTMTEQAAHVDAFVAASRYYADYIRTFMPVPAERMHVAPPGIATERYAAAPLSFDPPVIGYLSRMSESLGFGLLVEAFIRLKKRPELAKARLRATGGHTRDDRPFLARLERRLAEAGCRADVEFLPEFDGPNRLAFLRSLSVLSVPIPRGDAFGIYLVEALASGVPIVQPRVGSFPELIQETGGGVLYEPNDSARLASAIESLLLDPERARRLAQAGREAARARFSMDRAARRMIEIYESACRTRHRGAAAATERADAAGTETR